jgi:pimeloyl-ACP methyl ester carboxylesterase
MASHQSAMALFLLSLPLVSCTPFLYPTLRSRNTNTTVSSWANITASSSLKWTPCFSNYTCSLLTVPLDYSDPDVGTTNIAYIKLASNSTTAQDIVINPGGPGGSGVETVLTNGAQLAQYLGPSYNIIGFDPRGVGESGPSLDCFPDAAAAKAQLQASFGRPIDSQDPNSLSQEFAKAGAYGDWCSRVHKDGDAKYANTPANAADMLNYVEQAAVLSGQEKEDAKLWYYGLSYGTALGATFASLFPERVGKMILDGVVDSEMYYRGAWDDNMNQADEAVESFFTYCHAAGPEKCGFYANSTEGISARLSALIEGENSSTLEDPIKKDCTDLSRSRRSCPPSLSLRPLFCNLPNHCHIPNPRLCHSKRYLHTYDLLPPASDHLFRSGKQERLAPRVDVPTSRVLGRHTRSADSLHGRRRPLQSFDGAEVGGACRADHGAEQVGRRGVGIDTSHLQRP